jgi:hypothetical protein
MNLEQIDTNFGRIASRQRRATMGGLERACGLQDELLGATGLPDGSRAQREARPGGCRQRGGGRARRCCRTGKKMGRKKKLYKKLRCGFFSEICCVWSARGFFSP